MTLPLLLANQLLRKFLLNFANSTHSATNTVRVMCLSSCLPLPFKMTKSSLTLYNAKASIVFRIGSKRGNPSSAAAFKELKLQPKICPPYGFRNIFQSFTDLVSGLVLVLLSLLLLVDFAGSLLLPPAPLKHTLFLLPRDSSNEHSSSANSLAYTHEHQCAPTPSSRTETIL